MCGTCGLVVPSGERGRDRARAEFSVEQMARKTIDVYERAPG